MKVAYPLKACPWCGKTASFHMACPENETWLPKIMCKNSECKVHPFTCWIPIRRKQRENVVVIKEKVERLVKIWNDGNLPYNKEGFEIDYEKIVEDYKTGKLGLPGYRQEKNA